MKNSELKTNKLYTVDFSGRPITFFKDCDNPRNEFEVFDKSNFYLYFLKIEVDYSYHSTYKIYYLTKDGVCYNYCDIRDWKVVSWFKEVPTK